MLGSSMPSSLLQTLMGSSQNTQNTLPMQLAAMQLEAATKKVDSTSTASSASGGDTVTISMSANMLQQFLNGEMRSADADGGESDWTNLAQLKQQGEMLATLIKSKLRDFESNLIGGMKSTGFDASQSMSIKDGGDEGLLLTGATQNDPFQRFLSQNSQLKGQFQEVSQLVDALTGLQQFSTNLSKQGGANLTADAGAKYARQSQRTATQQIADAPQRPTDAQFVLRVMQGKASVGFE